MLSLETCMKLKEAGWPQVGRWAENTVVPTLEELLEAVRKMVDEPAVWYNQKLEKWFVEAYETYIEEDFDSPSEAVAALWLKLKAGA